MPDTDSREADAVRTLTFGMNLSLDGYTAAPGDDLGWGVPSDELCQWWSDRVGATGLALYGRRLWETMNSHWPTADQQPGATPAPTDVARRGPRAREGGVGAPARRARPAPGPGVLARRWRRSPKVVCSSTINAVGGNARLGPGDAVAEIT